MRKIVALNGIADRVPASMWFEGDDALEKGIGLCYNADYGTATEKDEHRRTNLELPTTANCMRFAGVTQKSYPARVGGQRVDILLPGGVAEVAVGVDTVVNSTALTCSCSSVDAGRFTQPGFPGRGSATALQTKASLLGGDIIGTAALDTTGLILTDGGATFVTDEVAIGDKVIIPAGESDGTNVLTPQATTVASITSETVLVLATSVSDGGTMQCNYYCISGNPTVLVYLQDGEESGLQHWISPVDNAAADCNEWGFSHIFGAVTLTNGDSTATLGNGTEIGQRKGFWQHGALTTQDYLVTVTTGIQPDGATDLNTLEFDADTDIAVLVWYGTQWACLIAATPAMG